MPQLHSLEAVTPALSIQPWNFAAKDPGVGGWRPLMAQARAADAAGIDRLVVSDHVILGENLEAYGDPKLGGVAGGRQPTGPDGQWLDPLILLSSWAALTKHTRLMTGILIAGLRRPANLAKAAATLDVLSEGRLDLGVGVGWQREEYEANGIPFDHRGARHRVAATQVASSLELCSVGPRANALLRGCPALTFLGSQRQGQGVSATGRPSTRVGRGVTRPPNVMPGTPGVARGCPDFRS